MRRPGATPEAGQRKHMREGHDPYGALRQPDYRRLLCGSVLFTLGTEMQAVAVGWELYVRTGTSWAFAFAGLAQFLPVLLFSLLAGQAADRLNRKGLLMWAQTVGAISSLQL